jgi:hypothetical protein
MVTAAGVRIQKLTVYSLPTKNSKGEIRQLNHHQLEFIELFLGQQVFYIEKEHRR